MKTDLILFLSFSPLFIGEVTVTKDFLQNATSVTGFQSPIHRGSNCNVESVRGECVVGVFQSPIHRGSNCNKPTKHVANAEITAFSPLFIGEVTVTIIIFWSNNPPATLSVPYSSGK